MISVAGAPHGWTEVVGGGYPFFEIPPRTELIYKKRSHGKASLVARNPALVPISATAAGFGPLVISSGCYFKQIPIKEEDLTEEEKVTSAYYEAWYKRREERWIRRLWRSLCDFCRAS